MENFLWFLGGTFFGSILACAVLSAVMLSSWESRREEAEKAMLESWNRKMKEAEERAKAVREETDKWGKPNPHRLNFGRPERKGTPWEKGD